MYTRQSIVSRRMFVGSVVSACAVDFFASSRLKADNCDRAEIQREIDAIKPEEYLSFMNKGASASPDECEEAYRRWPILKRYDDAFRRVVAQMRETKVVSDVPAVWYVYNMGVIVKTRETVFSMDLCHRLASTIADELDFAVISHNHDDHFTKEFYDAMDSRRKTVISNFADNYGACLRKAQGGFSRGECVYRIKDVTVRTFQSDHNRFLRGFVMPVDVSTASYSIFHSGDTFNTGDIRPVHVPDMWIHHPYCWSRKEDPGETVLGIRTFHPRLVVVAHHQELAHPCGGSRWTFAQAEWRKTQAEKEGAKAIVPFWGDRLV